MPRSVCNRNPRDLNEHIILAFSPLVQAFLSFTSGVGAWLLGGGLLWLIAGLLIGAVVPITFIIIMPTNQQLLAEDRDLGSQETRQLLTRWGKLHGVRSVLSGVATVLMLWGLHAP
jgi:uncharacterized membrane protein